MNELGSQIKWALTTVGITEERVSKWLGKPCGCTERQQKLDQLSLWAKRVLKGKIDQAHQYFNQIIGN
jgi:hypothetical protein